MSANIGFEENLWAMPINFVKVWMHRNKKMSY